MDLHSGHCTTGQPESVLCKHFAQMLQLLVANHIVLVLLLTFLFPVTKMWNINALQERMPCTICRICTSFQDALAIKVSLDLLKGLWSYGVFNLTGSGYPQIYSAPRSETMCQTPKRFTGARTCSRSSITIPSLLCLGFHPPLGWRKKI